MLLKLHFSSQTVHMRTRVHVDLCMDVRVWMCLFVCAGVYVDV